VGPKLGSEEVSLLAVVALEEGLTEGLEVLLVPTSSSPLVGDKDPEGVIVEFSICVGDGA